MFPACSCWIIQNLFALHKHRNAANASSYHGHPENVALELERDEFSEEDLALS